MVLQAAFWEHRLVARLPLNLVLPYLILYVRTPSTLDDSILKQCFEARTLMKPLTEWACLRLRWNYTLTACQCVMA
jgi:hypothetical protein